MQKISTMNCIQFQSPWGTIGVTLTISPFIYFPQQKAIAPIQRARIVIDVDSEISLNEMMDKEINKVLMATSGA